MLLKRKQARKIEKHFEKMTNRIRASEATNRTIMLNVAKAESFVKALKLAEVIDVYTIEMMKAEICEAETEAYKRKSALTGE